jgi:hypothetical protein
MAANNGAAKRLRKELLLLERAALKGAHKGGHNVDEDDVYLRPSSPDSILKWTALIKGPSDVSVDRNCLGIDENLYLTHH